MRVEEVHPEPEELAAFARGGVDAASAVAVERHLAHCEDCHQIVSDLRGEDEPEDAELDAAWDAMRSRIDPGLFAARRPARRWAAAAAALLAVGIMAWTVHDASVRVREAQTQLERYRRTIAEIERPHAEIAEIDLFPSGMLRDTDAGAHLSVPSDVRLVMFRLLPQSVDRAAPYRLEIIAENGGTIARLAEVRSDPYGKVLLSVSRDFLPPGEIRFHLFGQQGDSPLDTYSVHVAHE